AWIPPVFGTAIFIYGGQPFLKGGLSELRTRKPGMMLLIAMAIDASHGASGGVRALAEAAMRAGATKEEIGEALRVAFYISGCGSFYTAAEGLSNIIG
ncbi:MAG: carboxymuconolactone decarboxylase family protein, partial [Candidatus Methanosuratincola sp.]|nr:carboxymuconolactone decarboxylase family protein [Candidatus Methanosuratincola sp.]